MRASPCLFILVRAMPVMVRVYPVRAIYVNRCSFITVLRARCVGCRNASKAAQGRRGSGGGDILVAFRGGAAMREREGVDHIAELIASGAMAYAVAHASMSCAPAHQPLGARTSRL
jgi:hypothetical protein